MSIVAAIVWFEQHGGTTVKTYTWWLFYRWKPVFFRLKGV